MENLHKLYRKINLKMTEFALLLRACCMVVLYKRKVRSWTN